MSYQVDIRRNSDGLIRRFTLEGMNWEDDDPDGPQGSSWWWTEGNSGCDCNRSDYFAHAGDEDAPEQPCGDTAFSVLKAILPDGTERNVDEDL